MPADQVSQCHLDSKDPFYAGVYAYGKSEKRTTIVDGRARKSYGHAKPMDTWEVFIKDHHVGYISWTEYERNQALLAGNAYRRVGDTKSGRGGRALLAGLICCARCGRRLSVVYTGRYPRPVYRCEQPNAQLGQRRCLSVAGKRIDETIAAEMLRAVAPMAIEAAERMLKDEDQDRQRIAELELQRAQYDASLAERRYAACDPDNRLIAAQLEKAWESAPQRVDILRDPYRTLPFHVSDDLRHRIFGRYRYQHVNIIWHQMSFLDPALLPSCEIVKHLAQMPFYFAEKQLLAILRRKHDVVLALPGRVIKMIELCFHRGLLEGSWRFPKETS